MLVPLDPTYHLVSTTPKTKETKTMTTKKPGTSHGKPTAKGMKEALKPKAKATVKPKYPAPRVALEYTPIVTPKTTKDGLHTELGFVVHEWNKEKQEHAATGTKLDRALVDLKEARAKIKSLEATK